MTPRDAQIMIEAKRDEQDQTMRWQDALNGMVCATIAEPYRDRESHPERFSAPEFTLLPPEESEQDEPEKPGMTEEQIRKSISTMKLWVAHTGGTFNG